MKMKRAIDPTSAVLATTLEDLDKILHGGIACGSLTEVKVLQNVLAFVCMKEDNCFFFTCFKMQSTKCF